MFVWKASGILEQFKEFLPEVYACLVKIGDAMGTDSEMEAINEIYPVIPSISIDYGIMEKSDIVKVIFADMGWSDEYKQDLGQQRNFGQQIVWQKKKRN